MAENVFETIARLGVVPVIAIDSVDAALPLADALLEGGLPVAEITFRTAVAAEVIGKLTRERPELLVGAGTVLTVENLHAARDCGARFCVAPGTNPEIVASADEIDMPFVPGIATPSDIECALSLGSTTLKFFPAEAMGGVAMLQALSAPYAHTGVKFVPTGGVTTGNLESYLAIATVAAVGGTWIAKKPDLTEGKWADIRDRCRAVCEIVARVRRK
jgi:2-dehydro-3-deoxyphosphogluconate aldolase/(4S)-4-hydroxy-2-oxoglutarate aldolase